MAENEHTPSKWGKRLAIAAPIIIALLWMGRAALLEYKDAHPSDAERAVQAARAFAEDQNTDYCAASDKERWLADYKAKYQRDYTPKPECK